MGQARGWRAAAFQVFDTICGATQERQDALFEMLRKPMDLLLVVGGYNSSNTSHLVEIAEPLVPTFFIRDASCIKSLGEIVHFDLRHRRETTTYARLLATDHLVTVGITAGASCPNNLIEESIFKVFELRGVPRAALEEVWRSKVVEVRGFARKLLPFLFRLFDLRLFDFSTPPPDTSGGIEAHDCLRLVSFVLATLAGAF